MLPATARRARTALAASIVALLGAGAVVLPATTAHAVAPFPIEDPFAAMPAGTTMPAGWSRIASGAAQAAIVDDGAAGKWLRLTDDANNAAGAVYNTLPYEAEKGLSVAFDMRMYSPTDRGYRDGMSFFLQDAAVPLNRIGPVGGALGYFTDGSSSAPGCSNGLPGGVVGLGFDRYGNYQRTQTPNTVTLRGSSTGCYPVLASTGNKGSGYLESRGSTSATAPYRRVTLDFVPVDDSRVRIQVGMSPFTALGDEPERIDQVLDTTMATAALPDQLRLGWAASTGGASEYHEIRGVTAQQPLDLETTATVVEGSADLLPGDAVRIEASTRNNGPADIGGAADAVARTAADMSGLGLDDVRWTCTAVDGATCSTSSGSGDHVAVDWSGPAGSGIDIVVTGRVRAGQAAGSTRTQFVSVTDFDDDTLDAATSAVAKDGSVNDTDLANNVAPVSLDVVLEQPTATDDVETTDQGEAVAVDVAGNDTVDRTGTDPTTVRLTDAGLTGAQLDADGKRLTVPGQGTYDVAADGVVTFTPDDTFIGTATPVTYEVSSHAPQTAEATLTVTVRAGAVDAADDAATTGQGAARSLDVLANDAADVSGFDPTTLRFDAADTTDDGRELVVAGQGTWTVTQDGAVRFAPLDTFIGTATAHYDVATKAGQHTGATVSITVTADPVAAEDDRVETAQGAAASLDPLANDTADVSGFDPGSVRFADPAATDGGRTLTIAGQGTWTAAADGTVRFEPVVTFIGTATTEYAADTLAGQTVAGTLRAVVQPDPVSTEDDRVITGQAEATSVDVLANDTADVSGFDADSLSLDGARDGVLEVAGQGSFRVADGVVTFTPLNTFIGTTDPVRYRAETYAGQVVEGALQVEVTAAPVSSTPDSVEFPQGGTVDVDVLANDVADPSGFDPRSMRLGLAGQGTRDDRRDELVVEGQGTWSVLADGRIRFVPDPRLIGATDPVEYSVSTRAGQQVTGVLQATAQAAPVSATEDTMTMLQGEVVPVDVLANDVADPSGFDRGSLHFVLPAGDDDGAERSDDGTQLVVPGQGTWSVEDGALRFAPLDTFIGAAEPVVYAAETRAGQTVSAAVLATVDPAPVAAAADRGATTQGEPVAIDVLANDEADPSGFDPATLRFVAPDAESGVDLTTEAGTWTTEDGIVEFRPSSRFTGTTPVVTYTADTRAGQHVTSTIVVDVHAVGPRAADDTARTAFGQPVVVDVTANDLPGIDDGSPIERSTLVLLDDHGVETDRLETRAGVYAVTDGEIEYTPAAGFSGTAEPVSYRVSDSAGAPGSAQLTVTVEAEVLAFTGAVVAPLLATAGALLLGGLLLAVLRSARRRR